MTEETARTWPFWAPSQAESVEAALDLAGVGPGVRVCDLGCGDGQVVAAAAARGAIASGIEFDEDLVSEARARMAEAGLSGEILRGDLFDPELELCADVFFSYLAPATLQRLYPRLRTQRGATLVTVDFAVPGVVPTDVAGAAHRYELPGRRRRAGSPGWPHAGTLVVTVPDVQSLTCLELVHPAGPVDVRLSRPLAATATAFPGATELDRAGALAIDLRWEEPEPDRIVAGAIRLSGIGEHAVFVVASDEVEEAVWDLDTDAVAELQRALRRTHPPGSAAALVELLEC